NTKDIPIGEVDRAPGRPFLYIAATALDQKSRRRAGQSDAGGPFEPQRRTRRTQFERRSLSLVANEPIAQPPAQLVERAGTRHAEREQPLATTILQRRLQTAVQHLELRAAHRMPPRDSRSNSSASIARNVT